MGTEGLIEKMRFKHRLDRGHQAKGYLRAERGDRVPSPKAGMRLACSRDHKEPEWLEWGLEWKERSLQR